MYLKMDMKNRIHLIYLKPFICVWWTSRNGKKLHKWQWQTVKEVSGFGEATCIRTCVSIRRLSLPSLLLPVQCTFSPFFIPRVGISRKYKTISANLSKNDCHSFKANRRSHFLIIHCFVLEIVFHEMLF